VFARVEPWLQAGKYVAAVSSGLAKRNGWTIAEQAGDRTCTFGIALADGVKFTCEQAVRRLLKDPRPLGGPFRWERLQRRPVVWVGLDRYRLPAPPRADPPSSGQR